MKFVRIYFFAVLQECAPGTYTNYTGASECDICPDGFYCLTVQPTNADDNAITCPAGYYCPEGTGSDWQSCPAGTYSNTEGLYDVIQCTACPGGKYCEGEHQTTWTGDCDEGKLLFWFGQSCFSSS